MGGADGQFSSFPNTGFATAVATIGRTTDGIGWIANNSTGTNGVVRDWTFFVFRETFDLTGYDAATADLQFQWAADDSGQGFAARGTWVPQFSLNGGSLIPSSWPPSGESYSFGDVMTLIRRLVVTKHHRQVWASLKDIAEFAGGIGITEAFARLVEQFSQAQ